RASPMDRSLAAALLSVVAGCVAERHLYAGIEIGLIYLGLAVAALVVFRGIAVACGAGRVWFGHPIAAWVGVVGGVAALRVYPLPRLFGTAVLGVGLVGLVADLLRPPSRLATPLSRALGRAADLRLDIALLVIAALGPAVAHVFSLATSAIGWDE